MKTLKIFLFFLSILLLSSSAYYFLPLQIIIGDKETYLQSRKRKLQEWYFETVVSDLNMKESVPYSEEPIEVIIPIIEKDIPTVAHTIESIRCLVIHPVNKIYLIGPESSRIREVCKEYKVEFIDENTILPSFSHKVEMRGWYKQQFIKLNADKLVKTDRYLVIDADTIFTRPQVFVTRGRDVLNTHIYSTYNRKKWAVKVLNFNHYYAPDFTIHHMLFEKRKLSAMKKRLEKLYGKIWYEALYDNITPDFSEYELYAHYVLNQFRDEIKILPGRNSHIPRSNLSKFEMLQAGVASFSKSISLHL